MYKLINIGFRFKLVQISYCISQKPLELKAVITQLSNQTVPYSYCSSRPTVLLSLRYTLGLDVCVGYLG